jgi:hypothetical protein
MDSYKQASLLNKPEIYKDKWLKFDKTVLYPMEINDCNDTIDGVCFKNLTLDECSKKCIDDCDYGYHIETANESICVPIRSKINIDSNPSFRLRNQNIYNLKDDVSITYFQNKDLYNYPPSNAYVYYNSIVKIREYYNKDAFLEADTNKNKSEIHIGKNGTNVFLRPKIINTFIDNTTKVRYNQYLTIHVPLTTLIMRENADQKIAFDILDSEIKNKYQQFAPLRLFSFENINGNKDYIKWFEPFYIKTSSEKYLSIVNNKINVSQQKEDGTLFCLTPQNIPYYCNNGICESTEIENVVMNEEKDSLVIKDQKGTVNKVYFENNCWNNCNHITSNNTNIDKNYTIFTVLMSFVFLTIIIIIIIFVIKHHE